MQSQTSERHFQKKKKHETFVLLLVKRHLLAARDVQDLGELPQVSGDLLQQQLEAVPDDVDLLLGLQAVAALRVDQQLQGQVLQRGHFELRVQQLLADFLLGSL